MLKHTHEPQMKRKVDQISVSCTQNKESCCNDVYSRVASTNKKGRGSLAGWTTCPLCNVNGNGHTKSQKKFSLGRGIAMHLEQIHTPWNPGKAELARRERIRRRFKGLVHQLFRKPNFNNTLYQNENENHTNNHDIQRNQAKQEVTTDMNSSKLFQHFSKDDYHINILPTVLIGESEEKYYCRVLQQKMGKVWNLCKKANNLKWDPSENEIEEWKNTVIKITQQVEQDVFSHIKTFSDESATSENVTNSNGKMDSNQTENDANHDDSRTSPNRQNKKQKLCFIQAGHDRDGNQAKSYKESLPPFIKAASEGNFSFLKQCVERCRQLQNKAAEYKIVENTMNLTQEQYDELRQLIEARDRNGSLAEHWAAGGGYLDCLRYIFELRSNIASNSKSLSSASKLSTSLHGRDSAAPSNHKKKYGRRDGKTCLHYAARNGHNHIIDYLMLNNQDSLFDCKIQNNKDTIQSENKPNHKYSSNHIDVKSGDGSTPLHLACYGGHTETIRHLISKYKANIFELNDWGCGIGHWISMTIQKDVDKIIDSLDYIKECISVDDDDDDDNNNSKNLNNLGNKTIDMNDINDNTGNLDVMNTATFTIFGKAQKQGHSAVHKAAQKLNRFVIEWIAKEAKDNWSLEQIKLAGEADVGGNIPSQIWVAMGGEVKIAQWMNSEYGW